MVSSKRVGFTLMEMIVVVAIIGIVSAITFPVFQKAKRASRVTQTIQNMKSLHAGAVLYQADHESATFGTPEAMGLPPDEGTVKPFPNTNRYLAPWYAQMKSPFGDQGHINYLTFAIDSRIDRLNPPWADCTKLIGTRCILYYDTYEPGRDPRTQAWWSTVNFAKKRMHGISLEGSLVTHEAIGEPRSQIWWNPELLPLVQIK